ncbi:uncharacterized protein N7506_012393 [Penicillium brevicompactum]|uniref:uncharacterized protein n=1 Tax=Penicillium brevicompactum TaxID=5074 RepID=UPI0025425B57|nr:uncharacterized protein N7506_012387 [Penicillium brevicompactum]XP_056806185.1 uncharacterized protein N7506_012393 [Penicillium brevicompactum]KAJ5319683.1 hypothetical protein N7506_012387 [Penicillium brevicompactum]KAJ5319689.1 hypothetical protein N7506_012393 [Penicillium brevicompactum]
MLASSPPPLPTGEISPPFAPGANWRVVPRPRRRGRTPGSSPPTPIPLCARRRAPIPPSPSIPEIPLHRHLPTPPRPPTGDLAPPAPQGFPGPHPRARVAILGSNALGETAEGYTVGQMYEEGNPWGQGQRRRGSPCQRLPAANILDPPGSLSSYIISTE